LLVTESRVGACSESAGLADVGGATPLGADPCMDLDFCLALAFDFEGVSRETVFQGTLRVGRFVLEGG